MSFSPHDASYRRPTDPPKSPVSKNPHRASHPHFFTVKLTLLKSISTSIKLAVNLKLLGSHTVLYSNVYKRPLHLLEESACVYEFHLILAAFDTFSNVYFAKVTFNLLCCMTPTECHKKCIAHTESCTFRTAWRLHFSVPGKYRDCSQGVCGLPQIFARRHVCLLKLN